MKCPFSCTDHSFFCMDTSEDGQFRLKEKHAYFCWIQLQEVRLCKVDHSDFVIWSASGLVVFRIERYGTF